MPKQDAVQIARSVGRRIAELRRQRGWRQAELAEQMGVSVKYLSRVEVGANCTIATLTKVANALGVNVADLLTAPVSPAARKGRPRKVAP